MLAEPAFLLLCRFDSFVTYQSKTPLAGRFALVREVASIWNTLQPQLVALDSKLGGFGLQIIEGKTTYPEASNEFEDSG